VQGVAEVVPVSSSAQLSLLPWLLGWPPEPDRTSFAAGLHAGSSVGIALALRKELMALDRAQAGRLLLTSVPAAVAGLVGQDAIEARLGRPGPTAALLVGAGALMWLADRRAEDSPLATRHATAAALAQVLALAPGVSRSGASLTALRALRAPGPEAMRFSLLMSLPVTAGAGLLTMARARKAPELGPALVAGVAAYGAAKALDRASYRVVTVAALYRAGVAALVAVRLRTSQGYA
jgi:undecaprenyl-diphosphatase